jgi:hypothetical protein
MAGVGETLAALIQQIKLGPLLDARPNAALSEPGASAAATRVPGSAANAASNTSADATQDARGSAATRTGGVAQHATAQSAASTANASTFTRLSLDASLLSALIDAATQSKAPAPTPNALNVAQQNGPQLAQTLNQSLQQSGLFYESHLGQWVAGERALDSLRAEPHNARGLSNSANAIANANANPNASSMLRADADSAGAKLAAAISMPEALNPVVREQLDAIDLRRVLWQGEVWPQQQAKLEVSEEERRAPEPPESTEENSVWHSKLTLDLPELGHVEIGIALDPRGLQLRLHAATPALDALMRNDGEFRNALADAGIALHSMDLEHHD